MLGGVVWGRCSEVWGGVLWCGEVWGEVWGKAIVGEGNSDNSQKCQ